MKAARPKRRRQRAAQKAVTPKLPDDVVAEIEAILKHRFSDRGLLDRAFTHPSALPGGTTGLGSNQRLEFLGDRVLGLVIAERLFSRRRTEREGDLAPRLNRLVNKRACADAVRHMNLGRFVLMSRHEIAQGGRERDSTLGDVCESVIAALYLDGGLKQARTFIERAFSPQFEARSERPKDPKTRLQEWALANGYDLPVYSLLERTGPDHAPRFRVAVSVGESFSGEGNDRSKQLAERAAAQSLMEKIDMADNGH